MMVIFGGLGLICMSEDFKFVVNERDTSKKRWIFHKMFFIIKCLSNTNVGNSIRPNYTREYRKTGGRKWNMRDNNIWFEIHSGKDATLMRAAVKLERISKDFQNFRRTHINHIREDVVKTRNTKRLFYPRLKCHTDAMDSSWSLTNLKRLLSMQAHRMNCMSALKQAKLLKASTTHHTVPALLLTVDAVNT